MENPLEILGIKDQTSDEDIVKDIESRIRTISKYIDDTKRIFKEDSRGGYKFQGTFGNLYGTNIEEDLAERFACGFDCKNRFFSYYEFKRLNEKIEREVKKSIEASATNKSPNALFYSSVFLSQSIKLQRRKEFYQKTLDRYEQEGRKGSAREALKDLYVSIKFEDAVTDLAESVAQRTPRTFSANEDKLAFEENLKSDENYIKLKEAYEKVATESARAELVPEMFVKRRLGNPNLWKVASSEWKAYIIKRENKYKIDHLNEIADELSGKRVIPDLADNPDHDFSWGVVVDNPSYVMKNVPVDNADFQGRISVKHLGYFSAETLFSKRKLLREKHENIEIVDAPVTVLRDNKRFRLKQKNGKDFTVQLKVHTPNPDIPESMREYYYRHEATTQLFNNIYLVQKTDAKGVVREDLVFSPLEKKDFSRPELKKFLPEVYFSDYALNIARENGGFAGAIVKTPNGPSISTVDSQTEIAASVLYQNDSEGRLIDRSDFGNNTWKDIKGSEANFILRHKSEVRERSKDE